jgi:ABC-2 type transport system ATP-binding protein
MVLCAEGLTKSYGPLIAVDDVSLQVTRGEVYGLLGPNGAGKTTVISMVAGLLEPDSGHVTVDGRRVTTRSVAAKSVVGLVPQEVALYPDLTGRENLAFFARLYGLRGKAMAQRIGAVLEVVGLTERADDLVGEYSGGMSRRLNLGTGLLHQPRLLILDEPTVGVDPQSRSAILDGIAELASQGMAVLYTTHYMEEAERLCHRVGIVEGGAIKAEGTRQQLVALVGELDRIALGGTGALDDAARAATGIAGVESASPRDGGIEVVAKDAGALLPALLSAVADAGVHVTSVHVTEPDLESAFLHITGKALRDG